MTTQLALPATPTDWAIRFGGVFLFGATAGFALDQIHVQSGATVYTHPVILGAAWWVPLLFGSAALVLSLGPWLPTRWALGPRPPVSLARVGLETLSFTAAYLLTGVLHPYGWITLGLLVAWFAARVTMDRPTARELAVELGLAACTCLGGIVVENLLILAGTFRHVNTGIGLVPLWLPGLYLHAHLIGRSLGRAVFGGS